MDPHGVGQVQSGGARGTKVGADDHLEWAVAPMTQLAGWATDDGVPSVEPNAITQEETRRWEPVPIGVRGVPLLDLAYLGPYVVADLAEYSGRDVNPPVIGVVSCRR